MQQSRPAKTRSSPPLPPAINSRALEDRPERLAWLIAPHYISEYMKFGVPRILSRGPGRAR